MPHKPRAARATSICAAPICAMSICASMLLFSAPATAQPQPTSNPAASDPDSSSDNTAQSNPYDDASAPKDTAPTQPPTPPTPPKPPAPPPNQTTTPPTLTTPALTTTPAADTNSAAERYDAVFAEDWWHMARPVLELHGYLRTRAELFHNFSLGRSDLYEKAMWPVPADSGYAAWSEGQLKPYSVNLCGNDASRPEMCKNKSQAGANLRFRVNPELHISDNLRIMSQIDMLDNLVLGSTPVGYANQPSSSGGYVRTPPSGYTPLGVYNASVDPPVAGVNSYANSITVKRVWGEYLSPVGLFRFGRMPSHWGLGMVENSGDGFDSDYHTTVDRLMFTTGLKSFDLYFSAAWDFPNEGATSQTPGQQQGQPFDLSQLDDVNQYVVIIARKKPAAVQRLALSRGDVVLNGGVHFAYRHQFLANDSYGSTSSSQNLGATSDQVQDGYVRRNARIVIPDLWLQLLYRGFRFEAEAVMIRGSMDNTAASGSNYENTTDPSNNGHKVKQYGVSTQTEYRAVDNRLSLQFGFGWASGDPDVVGPQVGGLTPGSNGLQPQRTSDRTDSTFRFHPDYRVDLILHRHILSRVQGTYYFRPSLDYDFSRKPNGQKIGGGASVIWTRASEFVQAPGHKRDLGIELNAQLYFQSKDGSLNDDPEQMGGFYTLVQYGVLFPLGGLGYLPGEVSQAANQNIGLSTSAAHTLRWYCGIFF